MTLISSQCLHTRQPGTVSKKNRYLAVRNFRKFSHNFPLNPSKNKWCLFRNLKRFKNCIRRKIDEIVELRHRVESQFFDSEIIICVRTRRVTSRKTTEYCRNIYTEHSQGKCYFIIKIYITQARFWIIAMKTMCQEQNLKRNSAVIEVKTPGRGEGVLNKV